MSEPVTTLTPAFMLAQAQERYAALLERREVLNTELLALKQQIDALNQSILRMEVGLPENARLRSTPAFIDWCEMHDVLTIGDAELIALYRVLNEVRGTVYQAGWFIGKVPLDLILEMYRAALDQEAVSDGR